MLNAKLLQLSRNCREFSSGRRKVKIQMRISPNGKSAGLKKPAKSRRSGVAGSRSENPPSTNVSSPLRASKSRAGPRAKAATLNHGYSDDNFVVDDDEPEEAFETPRTIKRSEARNERPIRIERESSEDDFEPIRRGPGRPQHSRKREIGPPITIDEKVASLNPVHRDILEHFLLEAKKESERVSITASQCIFHSDIVIDQDVQARSCRTFLYHYTSRNGNQFPSR